MTSRAVAVIGAGTMGAGIAQVCAQAGWQTRLFDAFPDGLSAGMQRIDAFWEKGIARGKTTAEQKEEWSKNLIRIKHELIKFAKKEFQHQTLIFTSVA